MVVFDFVFGAALSARPQPAPRDFSASAARSGVTAPTAGPATPRPERAAARAAGEGGTVTNVSRCDKREWGSSRVGERVPPNPRALGRGWAFSPPRSAGGARMEGVAVEILWGFWLRLGGVKCARWCFLLGFGYLLGFIYIIVFQTVSFVVFYFNKLKMVLYFFL